MKNANKLTASYIVHVKVYDSDSFKGVTEHCRKKEKERKNARYLDLY